jgi:catechol 2,3-dioxygenase-like lactoylglutathione lyase family enzyme
MTDLSSPALLDRIDHIAIVVKSIKPAVDWYTQKFNCLIDYQDESWAYLRFNNINLALVIAEQHPSHIALAINNASQYGRLKRHRDGTESIYISDPDGNTLELVEATSLKSS